MAKTTTTTKKEAKKPSVPELARIDLPVQQQGLEKWAANPEDVIGRAADSPATVVNIPLEVIVESTENARRTFDQAELEGLAQSMRAVGLREAVELKPRGARDDGSPGAYELVDGARRYRAAKLLGWKTIPAWIHNDSDLVTATVRAVRNNQRVNLTPYEEALDFRNIVGKGATIEQVAALVGRSAETVKARLTLLDIPEGVARQVGRGGVTQQHAQVVHALLHEEVLKPHAAAIEKQVVAMLSDKREGRLLTPEEVTRQVLYALEQSGKIVEVTDYSVEQLVKQDAELRKFVDAQPELKVKSWNNRVDRYIPGAPEVKKQIEAAEKRIAEKAAKQRSGTRGGDSDRYAREQAAKMRLYREVRKRSREGIVKAAKAIIQYDDRVRDLVVLALVNHINVSKDAKIIAEASGIDVQLLGSLHDDKKLLALIQELSRKKDKGKALAQFAAAVALTNLAESVGGYNPTGSIAWNAAAKTWLGYDMKQLQERVKKDEKSKTASKKKGAKPAKAATTRKRADVEDDEDLADEEE